MAIDYKIGLNFCVSLLLVFSCESSQETKKSEQSDITDGSEKISEVPNPELEEIDEISTPCLFNPSFNKRKKHYEDDSWDQIYFFLDTTSKSFFDYTSLSSSGSCNDIGLAISNHEIKEDTLRVYTFWCSMGDPTGHEWGARIITYKWDCAINALKKIDSRLYIDQQGMEGGYALAPGENDPELVYERELFKSEIEESYDGKFVIGQEAENLIKRTKKFLKKDIQEITDFYKPMYENGFGFQI